MDKNRSKWIFLLISVMIVGMLSGCKKKEDVQLDVKTVADQLLNGIEFTDEMSQPEDDMFSYLYSEVAQEDVVNKAIYVSSGSTAEEIAVIEATDKEAAGRVKKGLETRVEDQKASFEGYMPEEMPKLEEPVLKTVGKYVILCVSNDNKAAEKVIEDLQK